LLIELERGTALAFDIAAAVAIRLQRHNRVVMPFDSDAPPWNRFAFYVEEGLGAGRPGASDLLRGTTSR
jgi:hypothetical protein